MKTITLMLACMLVIGACGSPGGSTAETGASPTATAAPGVDEATERQIGIWSATIRHLVTEHNTFEEGTVPFDHLYVLDHADANAASGGEREPDRQPVAPEVQAGIKSELSDLPPVEFVSGDGSDVIAEGDRCPHVENNGALITLGTIREHGNRVKVGMGMFVACLAGTWLTYVVKQTSGGWEVTGTTGPIAISSRWRPMSAGTTA